MTEQAKPANHAQEESFERQKWDEGRETYPWPSLLYISSSRRFKRNGQSLFWSIISTEAAIVFIPRRCQRTYARCLLIIANFVLHICTCKILFANYMNFCTILILFSLHAHEKHSSYERNVGCLRSILTSSLFGPNDLISVLIEFISNL